MRYYGEIKWFGGINHRTQAENDFGFIENIGDSKLKYRNIYFHKDEILFDLKQLTAKMLVSFDLFLDPYDRPKACNVNLLKNEANIELLERCFDNGAPMVWLSIVKNYPRSDLNKGIIMVEKNLDQIIIGDSLNLTNYLPKIYFFESKKIRSHLRPKERLNICFQLLNHDKLNSNSKQEIVLELVELIDLYNIPEEFIVKNLKKSIFINYEPIKSRISELKLFTFLIEEYNNNNCLSEDVLKILKKNNYKQPYINMILSSKIIYDIWDSLPSVLKLDIFFRKKDLVQDIEQLLYIIKDIPEEIRVIKMRMLSSELKAKPELFNYLHSIDKVNELWKKDQTTVVSIWSDLDDKTKLLYLFRIAQNDKSIYFLRTIQEKEPIVRNVLNLIWFKNDAENKLKIAKKIHLIIQDFINNNEWDFIVKYDLFVLFPQCSKVHNFYLIDKKMWIKEKEQIFCSRKNCYCKVDFENSGPIAINNICSNLNLPWEKWTIFELLVYLNADPEKENLKSFYQYETSCLQKQERENNKFKLEQNNREFKIALSQTKVFSTEIEATKKTYFTYFQRLELSSRYRSIYDYFIKHKEYRQYKDIFFFLELYPKLERFRINQNKSYVKDQLLHADYLLSDIDGKSLDYQQRNAVVVDEDNNLVLAGAGSGKTLTIAGKVAYLVYQKSIDPADILLITFTKKAAQEMEERVVKKLGIKVDVKTFHGLGNYIISQATQKKPTLEENIDRIIDEFFKVKARNIKDLLDKLFVFFGNYLIVDRQPQDFNSLGDYFATQNGISLNTLKEICKRSDGKTLTTLKQEIVKSTEELKIANFLFLNSICYEYEKEYVYETGDLYHRQYRPDFYLPEYGIYIEHFGVNRQGRLPQFTPIEEKKYLEDISWKRNIHKIKKTILYETYSYQFREGTILEDLNKDLTFYGVKMRKLTPEEMYNYMANLEESKVFKGFKKIMSSFLMLYKSAGYDKNQIDKMMVDNECEKNEFMKQRTKLFLEIFKELYSFYEGDLESKKRIDFNDMINMATCYILENKVKCNYKYIIIDEYQDISNARFQLIKAIRNQCKSKIMCVGDDWQSIYRFAGSDINLFTSFEERFGYTEVVKIEKTYRNSQDLIDIAAAFVMKNPIQSKKELKSHIHLKEPVTILSYVNSQEKALKIALDMIGKNTKNKDVLLLGRNNFDIDFLKNSNDFKMRIYNGITDIKCVKHPELNIRFLTVHKSKGLEADEVVILNCNNSIVGFPNQIYDDPILDLVITRPDEFAYSEERRLFYVAITRTKNHSFLLTSITNQSVFVTELVEHGIPIVEAENNSNYNFAVKCPRCSTGLLVKRQNQEGGIFLGCSNYPACDYTYKDANLLINPIKCSVCGGYMIEYQGSSGNFYGCSNYPQCKNVIK